jgi:hypothetical protein
VERARLYVRYRPMPLLLLADPDCRTHQAFGVPRIEFLPEGSSETPEWPSRARMADFEAARINPTGELPEPTQPMAANGLLNAQDGFEMNDTDNAIMASHATQLAGHFLVDEAGTIAWEHIEAPDGPSSLCYFPARSGAEDQASSLGCDGPGGIAEITVRGRITATPEQAGVRRLELAVGRHRRER